MIRLIGGLAIHRQADGSLHPALRREYRDIDLVTTVKQGQNVGRFLKDMGYEANERFNAMNAGRRLLFHDVPHGRQIDVFVGEFEMCHKIAIADRLELDPETVPLAELLLTKLQIFQLNEKDLKDLWAIVYHHDLAEHDADAINIKFVATLLAADWGLWRTSARTIQTAREHLATSELSVADRDLIEGRLRLLWSRVEAQPKTMGWRMRAKVGDRMKWYEEPEEVAGAGGAQ